MGRVAEPRRRDASWNRSGGGFDVSALFVLFAGGPLLLPVVAAGMAAELSFVFPSVVLLLATIRCVAAARRNRARLVAWVLFATACGLATVASLLALAAGLGGGESTSGLYVGALASAALLAAVASLTRRTLIGAPAERLVDSALLGILFVALGLFFVAIPGFAHGDRLLTMVFVVDLCALFFTALFVMARRGSRHRRMGWALLAGVVAITIGDAAVTVAAAERMGSVDLAIAVLWAVGGFLLTLTADTEVAGAESEPEPPDHGAGQRWIVARVVLPLAAVLALPTIAGTLWLRNDLEIWSGVYFGSFALVLLLLAFGRQAYLLVDNQRAVVRERGLRQQVVRRNEELEAVTGLATTMTQTLEEGPIIERGLDVIRLAGRATSSALHTLDPGDGSLALTATAGAWDAEHAWGPPRPGGDPVHVETRGRRQIVRLALVSRGDPLGTVSLMRPDDDPFDAQELQLLRLLADQLAIALQNARDYRLKLEQAIRDPLTGLYNRRFFYEALDKEMRRHERYGSSAALVLFDVDDFKSINDTRGHAAGDEVLRRIATLVQGIIRPADSFARTGGEEFGLLMPETDQFRALQAAERVRAAVARAGLLPDRRVTLSGGVAWCPVHATTAEGLLKRADDALYWAKRNGKNLCAVASEVVLSARDSREGMLAHLYALVTSIDAEQLHTRDHSENVAAYAVALGQRLGMAPERIIRLRRAALLHDIGKIAVSEEILAKPGALDRDEIALIREHPVIGASMLAHSGLDDEARWIRHHHERFDGMGYPSGLAGEEIPIESRVIFVADAFEAMTSDRPYRRGMEVERAVEELRRCSGSQFDPAIVDLLVDLVASDELTVLALRD